MKTRILVILLILALAVPLTAAPPSKMKSTPATAQSIDNTTWINVNNIFMFVTNHGNFARDLTDMFGQDAGTFYPYTTVEAIEDGSQASYANYASGLWIGGQVGGQTRIVIAEYEDEYVPGPMTGTTFSVDKPEFKVYKLYKDSLANNPNQDYSNWPNALLDTRVDEDGLHIGGNDDQKAPIRFDTTWVDPDADPLVVESVDTIPDMLGDQMLWAVYNDADPAQHTANQGETLPLGLEVRQTTFGFNREDPLGNIIFLRWRVYNKGGNQIENCYFSIWDDPDLGGAGDDLVACDTALSMGYVWNATNNDATYGSTPPALGYDFFQGPMVAASGETAKAWGQFWPDKMNLPMVSFNKYINGTDPNNFDEAYNYMQGLAANGADYLNPDGIVTLFQHAGDPVTGTGDIDFDPADRRMMMSTGPVSFAPTDSTEILAAMIIGRGSDRLSSISVMKYFDQFAQSAYDIDFQLPDPPAAPVVTGVNLDGEVSLMWTDISETDHGDYDFEGYTVYQGQSAAGPWTRVANYDINNGVGTILDAVMDIETGTLEERGVKFGSDPGVRRYFFTDADGIMGGPLNNVTTYYFKVEAYSYDPAATPKTLTSATSFSVTPQRTVAEVSLSRFLGDTLEVTHAGGSNGNCIPVVLDPASLTGHDYQISFEDTIGIGPGIDIAWHLDDLTNTTRLLEWQTNQDGDDDYTIVDGMVIKITGPAFGVIAIDEVATAAGPLDPVDNVMYSRNSTSDWYISSDAGSDFSRMNWRELIGTSDWEIRFTAGGSNYYDWDTDGLVAGRAPFEFWNIGIGTPDDPSDDVRINFAYLDDDVSGGWSYGDRIYACEHPYTEPAPDPMDYAYPDDFHIGRIVINDLSEATTAPAEGTIIRFSTAKVNTTADVFTFTAAAPTTNMAATVLDDIKVVPNPFYLYGPYDPAVGNHQIKFNNLPAECTINIYNLAGEFIDQINKNDDQTAIASWNGLTDDGLPVASGIYLYVVEARGIGTKIGKFAIFTEVEVLKKY